MSEQARAAADSLEPHVLSVEDLWALTTYNFTLLEGPGGRPCVLKMRRMDLLTRLMEDVVNAPLLKAAMEIVADVQQWLREDSTRAPLSAFENLDDEKKRTLLEAMQQFACKVVLQPPLTLDRQKEPHAFPVTMFTAEMLFAIWNHKAPDATVPRLSEVAATRFSEAAGADAGVAASHGGGVRQAASGVDSVGAAAGEP